MDDGYPLVIIDYLPGMKAADFGKERSLINIKIPPILQTSIGDINF